MVTPRQSLKLIQQGERCLILGNDFFLKNSFRFLLGVKLTQINKNRGFPNFRGKKNENSCNRVLSDFEGCALRLRSRSTSRRLSVLCHSTWRDAQSSFWALGILIARHQLVFFGNSCKLTSIFWMCHWIHIIDWSKGKMWSKQIIFFSFFLELIFLFKKLFYKYNCLNFLCIIIYVWSRDGIKI